MNYNPATGRLLLSVIMVIMTTLMSCHQPSSAADRLKDAEADSIAGDAATAKGSVITEGLVQSPEQLLAGQTRALCYSGFRSGQHPDRGEGAVNPSEVEVLEDLRMIQNELGITLIRLYDCGPNTRTVLQTIATQQLDIRVLLGIWLRAELSAHETCSWLTEPIPQPVLDANRELNRQEIQEGIRLANQYPDIIVAVNVGNEALVSWNDHKVDPQAVIAYVKEVKSSVPQPATVADNYEWWAGHGRELAAEVDFVSIHTYPLWEGRPVEEALAYTLENIRKVKDSLPGATIVITEAGWASESDEFSLQTNENNQQTYYTGLMYLADSLQITTFWFEAMDEDWKGDANPRGIEKHWGLYTVDR